MAHTVGFLTLGPKLDLLPSQARLPFFGLSWTPFSKILHLPVEYKNRNAMDAIRHPINLFFMTATRLGVGDPRPHTLVGDSLAQYVKQCLTTSQQRWQQVIFCKSKSSHKSFPCKSKSSHKSFGQTSSQAKSQVIWSKHKSSHKSLCPSTSQVAHYFVQL